MKYDCSHGVTSPEIFLVKVGKRHNAHVRNIVHSCHRYELQAFLRGLKVIMYFNTTKKLESSLSAAWSPVIPTVQATMQL